MMPLLLPLAQGATGIALVIGLALLGTRQVAAAVTLLAVQSLAVAAAALASQAFASAALTLALNVVGMTWAMRRMMPGFDMIAEPLGGPKLGILGGAALAVLSQAHGDAAQPFAVLLVALLLASTRRHSLAHLVALVAVQNAGMLASVRADIPPWVVAPSFLVPTLFAATLGEDRLRLACARAGRRWEPFLGWAQVAVAVVVLATTLAAPLDRLGTIIAPMVAAWGVAIAWSERRRRRALADRIADTLQVIAMLVAVAAPVAWIAVPALATAAAAALFPTARRRLDALKLACLGGGIALFGLYAVPLEEQAIAAGALVLGLAAILGVAPNLATVAGIVVLRLVLHGPWSATASLILVSTCAAVLLAAGAALFLWPRRAPVGLLRVIQAATIGMALAHPETVMAAMMLILLLIVTEIALALVRHDPPAAPGTLAATAALAGVPPLGLFPGLVMLTAGLATTNPWLLAPVGVALSAAIWVGLPRRRGPAPHGHAVGTSVAWLPIVLPVMAGLALGVAAPLSALRWLTALSGGGG